MNLEKMNYMPVLGKRDASCDLENINGQGWVQVHVRWKVCNWVQGRGYIRLYKSLGGDYKRTYGMLF